MISVEQAIGITLASVVLIAVPGPSVMFVIGRALSYGRSSALGSVIGNAIGCYLVGVLIAFGLGPLLERSETLFQVIKWAGILFLFYLGVQALRHAGPIAAQGSGKEGIEHKTESVWTSVRTGILVGVTNPKSFVLFTAIVPQFIVPAAGSTTTQILILGIVPMIIGLITDATWALGAAKARYWLAKSPRRMTTIGRAGGLSIIGVGASVAFSGSRN